MIYDALEFAYNDDARAFSLCDAIMWQRISQHYYILLLLEIHASFYQGKNHLQYLKIPNLRVLRVS